MPKKLPFSRLLLVVKWGLAIMKSISVQKEDFNAGDLIAQLAAGGVAGGDANGDNGELGGIASFIGYVRAKGDAGSPLTALELEHYPVMTEAMLEALRQEAMQRWELRQAIIIHRYGKLAVGEQIVMVATASPHRQASLLACQFLIDWLKTKAPFWKAEHYQDGRKLWVAAKDTDRQEEAKWNR